MGLHIGIICSKQLFGALYGELRAVRWWISIVCLVILIGLLIAVIISTGIRQADVDAQTARILSNQDRNFEAIREHCGPKP